ncbi:MAG: Asp-tRNA(Asn)/Glu-tRNA(Gln) amidotransferase subunit GatB [bacterium]
MKYEAVIGLEIHAQLLTESKIFCGCSTKFGAAPNTNICPVCTGQPGVLPVLNKKVVEFAIKTGLALNGNIAKRSVFARKNYFYPDLPKNYQVSMYELPLVSGGRMDITVDGKTKHIGITRVHLEEDAGKLVHKGAAGLKGSTGSFVDLNRTGVPLMEIVTEPDIRSSEDAKVFMQDLRNLLVYLGVCDGNMEEGSLRCDANVSMRPAGQKELGTKTEVKNMNSFKAVQKALESEIKRQTEMLESGERIVQETRLFDDTTGTTMPMRSKEEAHDYRYFPEPDLVPVEPDKKWVDEIAKTITELPGAKKSRFMKDLGLPELDATVLTFDKALADFFEECLKIYKNAKNLSNWTIGDLTAYMNAKKIGIKDINISSAQFVEMLSLIDKGTISRNSAKAILIKMLDDGRSVNDVVAELGATQISDESELIKMITDVIKNNPRSAADYKGGKEAALSHLIGQVMKATKGRANPETLKKLLIEELKK